MPESPQIVPDTPFASVIRHFQEAGIRFVVIGGVALGLHGLNYLTSDIDFAYARDNENRERLAAFLATVHARSFGTG